MTFACDAKTEYRIGTDRLCVVFVYKKANAAKALPFQFVHPESHHDPSEPPVLLIRQNGQPCQLPHGRRCVIPAEEKLMLLIFLDRDGGEDAPVSFQDEEGISRQVPLDRLGRRIVFIPGTERPTKLSLL